MVFLNCYLAVPWPTLNHSLGDSLTNLISITAFQQLQPGHREFRNKVGSISPAVDLVGIEHGNLLILTAKVHRKC